MLSRQGLSTKDKDLKADNAAAVMVTASMPPFARVGTKIDVIPWICEENSEDIKKFVQ